MGGATELMEAWEAGIGLDHTGRALALVAASRSCEGDPANLTIGQRDRLLLGFRQRLFGTEVTALDTCGSCGERLEVVFDLRSVTVDAAPGQVVDVDLDGHVVRLRAPTSGDLREITGAADLPAARRALLQRCVVGARADGLAVHVTELPEEVLGAIGEAVGRLDPQADVQLAITCAQCGEPSRVRFDIVEFLWREVERRVEQTLRHVHVLAGAYGWTEEEIVALPAARRRRYLELVTDG